MSVSRLVAAAQARPASASLPLVLTGIERSFGSNRVLAGASLALEPGTSTWLGGPNGAGKTTLLRVAAGLILPDTGSVTLHDLSPEHDRREFQRRLGYTSAGDRGLYARLSVEHNLEYWAGIAHVAPDRRTTAVRTSLARFGLEELAGRRVDRLSMGQRQRVRLAMAFLHEPEVVLLDEPHTSLDDAGLGLLEAALGELRGRDGAALWCSPAGQNLPLSPDARLVVVDGRVESA